MSYSHNGNTWLGCALNDHMDDGQVSRKRTFAMTGCRQGEAGFTLLELIICITLMVVVATAVVPAGRVLIQSGNARAVSQQLFRAIQFTRTEAIRRGQSVVLCPYDEDSGACLADWQREWVLFVDSTGTGNPESPDAIVRTFPAIPAGQLTSAPKTLKRIRFNSLGFSPGIMGNLTYCPGGTDSDPSAIRRLILTMSGRIRWAQDKDGDGVIDTSSGKPVTCTGKG